VLPLSHLLLLLVLLVPLLALPFLLLLRPPQRLHLPCLLSLHLYPPLFLLLLPSAFFIPRLLLLLLLPPVSLGACLLFTASLCFGGPRWLAYLLFKRLHPDDCVHSLQLRFWLRF